MTNLLSSELWQEFHTGSVNFTDGLFHLLPNLLIYNAFTHLFGCVLHVSTSLQLCWMNEGMTGEILTLACKANKFSTENSTIGR